MSDLAALPPGLILVFAGFLIAGTRGRVQDGVIVLAPLLTLWWVWQVPDGVQLAAPLLGHELEIVKGTTIGRLFATIFAIMAFGGGLFALSRKNTVELSAAYIYAGSAIGVTFAGDLITLFVFWAGTAATQYPARHPRQHHLGVGNHPMTTPPATDQRRTTAILVYVIVILSLQVFLLVVALEAFQADEEGLAWSAAALSLGLFATALIFARLLRRA